MKHSRIPLIFVVFLILSLGAAIPSAAAEPAENGFTQCVKVGVPGDPSDHQYPNNMPAAYTGKLKPEAYSPDGASAEIASILVLSAPFTCEIVDEETGRDGVYYIDSLQIVDAGLSLRYGSTATVQGSVFLGLEGYHSRGLAMVDAVFGAPALPEKTPSLHDSAPGSPFVEAIGEASVRSAPFFNGHELSTVAKGGRASYAGSSSVDERGVRWYRVYYKGGAGWISSKCGKLVGLERGDLHDWDDGWRDAPVAAGCHGAFVKATGDVNVRSAPCASSRKLGTISKGDRAGYAGSSWVDGRCVRWYKVYYKDCVGWISSKYSKLVD